jgi:bifunctional non-homologous end joining protein LigD
LADLQHLPGRGSIWEHFCSGAYRGKNLCFVGKVGTGFDGHTLAQLPKAFRPLIRNSPPFIQPPREKTVILLEPRLLAQIAYQEWTADQKLRQPVFLGFAQR